MKKPTHRSSAKPHATASSPHPSPGSAHTGSVPARGEHAKSALQSFLHGAATASDPHADRLQSSARADESRQSAADPAIPRTPAWAHALAALETRHLASLQDALATQDASHRETLEQLQTRLAAAEHATATLASQLRELR